MGAQVTGRSEAESEALALLDSIKVPTGASFAALPAQDSSLEALEAFVDAVCDAHAASFRVRFDLQLALEELFVNVVRHGFEDGRPRAEIWLAAWGEPQDAVRELRFVIADAGVPYDPLGYRWQKVEASRGQANKVGGLGVLLVRERMDDVGYSFVQGRNVVCLTKRLGAAE